MGRKSKRNGVQEGHPLAAGVLRPGETLIASRSAEFPSGGYMRVAGFRSFRDFDGRDVSPRLPGWPPSKKPGEPPAKGSAKGMLLVSAWFLASLLQLAYEAAMGGDRAFSPPRDPRHRKDFQVLSADPGTVAFDAPWQLDPGRNKAKPRVVLHLTGSRLLFADPASGELLWEVAREMVKSVEFDGAWCYLRFVDQSWIMIDPDEDDRATASDHDQDYAMLMDTIDLEKLHRFDEPSIRFDIAMEAFAPASAAESH